jgi:serine/threonine-protein kinase
MLPPRFCPDKDRWADMLDGRLSADEQASLAEHLDGCLRCQQLVESLTGGPGALAGVASSDAELPDSNLQRVMDQLKAETTTGDIGEEQLDFLLPATDPALLGELGRYEVVKVIGRGGMGVVLKALDPALNRVVAVKVLAPQWAGSPAARRRFEREARAAAGVHHENVIAIHDVDEVNGLPFLVMEYVHGTSLEERLKRCGPPGVREILRIGIQVADGLAAAHQQGLVHRDVKPANILLENGVERVKITDFGLARAIDDASLTQSGVIAGTPLYMAPEQANGQPVDHRADLFSLGSVLYLLCAGRPAFRAPTTMAVLKRVCEEQPRPIREVNPDVPAWLEEIIAVLHAKDPADRFQSAEELSRLLSRRLAHLEHPGRVPEPPAPRQRRDVKQGGLPVWARVVMVVAALATALLLCLIGTPLLLLWAIWPKPPAGAAGAPQAEGLPRALLAHPKLVREPDQNLRFSVDYQVERGAPNATLSYIWVVRSGGWKVYERKLKQAELEVQGTLEGTAKAPALDADAPLETFLEVERLVPGHMGMQRERISDIVILNR